jgi:TadE-like protein
VLRFGRERGAVAVEMAVVVPILLLLAFGMLEFGLALKTKVAISSAVNSATRQGTVLGSDAGADVEILDALEAGLSGAVDDVVYVDIFKANPDGTAGPFDRYTRTSGGCGWIPCPNPGAGIFGTPAGYIPCSRDNRIGDGAVDTIGVRVAYTHTWISGVLGLPDQTWQETARARLEPDVLGVTGPPC